jgi:hypothetical protein
MVREGGAEHAKFTGASDVDEVRPESAEGAQNTRGMTPIERVVTKIFIEGEGGEAAGELERLNCAFESVRLGAFAGPDAKKWLAGAASPRGELARRVGDAIDLMEGVGKERNPGDTRHAAKAVLL